VEVVMAAGSVFLWQWSAGDIGKFYASVAVAFIFLLITLIDIEHRLILWRTVWVSALVLLTIGVTTLGWQKTLLGGVVGYVIVFVLFLVGQLYEWLVARWRGRPLDEIAFGGGDVNLAALVGLAVGWTGVLFALLIGIVTAGLYSLGFLGWQLARGRYSPHAAFPYGPFLVLGAMVMYLYGRELAGWWLGR
jgi:prepilin signal peptidase PulO-like enzyme (type II secretory pathway)